jgi:restriction system protein
MAETTRRRAGELLRKLFEILLKYPEGLPAKQALERLAESVQMTAYESGVFESSGVRRFEKLVRFGTVDCVKAGWLVKQDGVWIVTKEGQSAWQELKDPEAFYKKATQLYRQWKAKQQDASEIESDIPVVAGKEAAAEKSVSIAFEKAEEDARTEIRDALEAMNPYEFQDLVADLLVAMGYFISWKAPPGKDGGIDIIAHPDPLGANVPRIKVQVKRFVAQKVDADGVKAFAAMVGDDDAGIFVSLAGFTRDAETYARAQERKRLTLIEANKLIALWIRFYEKLDSKARARLPLTPIYFLTPQD